MKKLLALSLSLSLSLAPLARAQVPRVTDTQQISTKQTFTAITDPASPTNGDFWRSSTTADTFKYRSGGVTYSLLTTAGGAALVSDTAYDATSWNGVTTIAPSKNAVRDIIEQLQPLDATLTALAAFNTNGIFVQTAADTFTARTITGTANEITVADGNGVSSNPTLSLPAALTFTGKTVTGGTFSGVTISGASTFSGTTATIGATSYTSVFGSANTSASFKAAYVNTNSTAFASLPLITSASYEGGFMVHGADGVGSNLYLVAYGSNSVMRGDTFAGTAASPTALTSGTQIGGFQWRGYDGTALGSAAGIVVYAVEDFTTGAHGTNFTIRTTAKTTTAFGTKLTLTDAGNLLLGSNATTTGAGNSNGVIQLASTGSTDGLAIGTRAAEVIYRTANDALRTDSSWTVAGRVIGLVNSAASLPAGTLTGTWFTGGSATTTKPHFLIEPSGTTTTGWNTAGTGLGINGPSSFAGLLADFQVDGAVRASILSTGIIRSYRPGVAGQFVEISGLGSLSAQLEIRAEGSDKSLTIANITTSTTSNNSIQFQTGTSGAPSAILSMRGASTRPAWGLVGAGVIFGSTTQTDSSTATSGTAATAAYVSFGAPTYAASNATVTTTDAINVYFVAAPGNGTNQTFTRKHVIATGSGRVTLAYAGSTSSEDGLWWSTDVNAYRSAANTLTFTASSGAVFTGKITTLGGATFHTTSSALTDGAGASTATFTNAPSAGNPTKWIGINDNGTTRYIPAF